jgi:hypothetical protein
VTPHIWLSRVDNLDAPDQMMFDLDPSGDRFEPVKAAAQSLKELLDQLHLPDIMPPKRDALTRYPSPCQGEMRSTRERTSPCSTDDSPLRITSCKLRSLLTARGGEGDVCRSPARRSTDPTHAPRFSQTEAMAHSALGTRHGLHEFLVTTRDHAACTPLIRMQPAEPLRLQPRKTRCGPDRLLKPPAQRRQRWLWGFARRLGVWAWSGRPGTAVPATAVWRPVAA